MKNLNLSSINVEINVINSLKHIRSLTIKDENIFPEQELLDCLNKIPKYKENIVHYWGSGITQLLK